MANARHLGSFALPQEALLASAKLKVLSELLPELLAKGSKVLLFSQWTQVKIEKKKRKMRRKRKGCRFSLGGVLFKPNTF